MKTIFRVNTKEIYTDMKLSECNQAVHVFLKPVAPYGITHMIEKYEEVTGRTGYEFGVFDSAGSFVACAAGKGSGIPTLGTTGSSYVDVYLDWVLLNQMC